MKSAILRDKCCLARWKSADVSEEHIAPMLEWKFCFPPTFTLILRSASSLTLNMETISHFETSVDFQLCTRSYIPENGALQVNYCVQQTLLQITCGIYSWNLVVWWMRHLYSMCTNVKVNLSLFITIWPPLWSSGQSSWLQIRRPGFDSRHYQKKVMCLERGPLSLVSTTEELLDRKVAAPV
jgi:hypothetical protein